MFENIYRVQEIRDDRDGEDIVNSYLRDGWILLNVCQVGTSEAMDLVYVVGATKEVYDSYCSPSSRF